jgi:Subtilase family
MSFGFSQELPVISRAIRKAVLDRDDAILFFAAAANYGANEEEMFPANHESVISIRGTNFQGHFPDFNPPRSPDESVVYGTLGTDVPSAWLRDHPGEMHKSGTSVATPIAAGIAAIVLGYVGGKSEGGVDKLLEKRLRSRRGMLAIFKTMAKDMGNGCSFLNPWNFFREEDSVCLSRIVAAVSKLPR